MNILRCLLLLGLIAAASATFSKRLDLSRRGNCGLFCGFTKRNYQPSRNSGKCLGIFHYLAAGVDAKLGLIKDIFNSYSNIGVATDINVAVDTCINLSRGIALIIDQWVSGLGAIYENLVIGISRLIFCVLDNPWKQGNFIQRWFTLGRNKSPAVCSKDFGLRWGWRKYLLGYSNREEIFKYYNLYNIRAQISAVLKTKGLRIGGLKGTHKLIIDTLLKFEGLLQKKFSTWKRSDYVQVTKYLITVSAAVGSAYKAGAGVAVVEEYTEYLQPCYKKEFNVEIVEETTVIKEEITVCDTVNFGSALVVDDDIDVNVNVNDNSGNSNDGNNNGGNTNNNGGIRNGGKGKTTVTTTQWETVYDDEGNIISSTKPDDEQEY